MQLTTETRRLEVGSFRVALCQAELSILVSKSSKKEPVVSDVRGKSTVLLQ